MNTFFSPTAGCRVRWLDLPGSGIPLVFVHGLGCASSWDYPPIVADKVFAGRRAILIDLPGYGYSEKPEDYRYSIREQAMVVAELLADINLPHCVLYGHSMGGSICIEVAAMLTETVCGLVVSEPNFTPGGGVFSQQICRYDETRYVDVVHNILVANDKTPWAASMAVASPRAVWRGADSLIKGNDWMSMFLQLNRPKALIFGEQSLPDADFDKVNSSGVMTLVVPDCGHGLSSENPSGLAAALAQFCQYAVQHTC